MGEVCLRKIHSKKCKVPHLGRNITRHQYMSSTTHRENSFAEKNLRVLMDTKLNVSKQCFLAVKNAAGTLLCARRIVTWRLRDLIYTFLFLVRPHMEYWIQFCAPCYKRDADILQKCIYCERDQALTQCPPWRTPEQPWGVCAWAEVSLNFNNRLILWHWRCSETWNWITIIFWGYAWYCCVHILDWIVRSRSKTAEMPSLRELVMRPV